MGNSCSAMAWDGRFSYRCGKTPKVERDGKWYCTIHDPEYIAKKRQAWEDKYNKECAEKQVRWHRESLIDGLFVGVPTETIEKQADKIRELLGTSNAQQ